MSIYLIRGQKLDTGELVLLYGNREEKGGDPIYYWMSQNKKRFYMEHQIHWQVTQLGMEEISRGGMVHGLKNAEYPERAKEGLEKMGAPNEIEDFY